TAFTASGTGFNNGTSTVNIVQPALQLTGLNTTTTTFSANDVFQVIVGLPGPDYVYVSEYQAVRVGGGPLTATIASDNITAGQLVTSAGSGSPVSVEIAPGAYSSPNTVANGGVEFDPTGSGNTTISASITGFTASDAATVNVAVTEPQLQFYNSTTMVGAGLQTYYNTYRYVNLGATDHGGVTVRIQSDNPELALVSPDDNTAGTAFIDIIVPDGQQIARYITQGIAFGSTTLTATAPGFTPGTTSIEVVQPALIIAGLNTNTTTLSADDPIQVYLGLPSANNSSIVEYQSVRVGGGPLTATITSSDAAVGRLVTTAVSAGSVTIDIAPGSYFSPNTVVDGGVAFEPIGGGTVTISASIDGFIATTAASADVTVAQPQLQFSYPTTTVGAGLQTNYNYYRYVNLGATDHGGVTVHIESSNPQLALVSPDVNTPGTAFIDVVVPDGEQFAQYTVHGVEHSPDPVIFTATSPGFADGSATVTVVQPAVTITGLTNSTTTLSANSAFRVGVGIPTANNSSIAEYQAVRAGVNPLTVTVSSLDSNVGRLVTSGAASGSVTVNIDPGQVFSPNTVVDGGVAFEPLTSGTTTVSADIQGFVQTAQAFVEVTVETPQLRFYYTNLTVGAGLQSAGSYRYVDLGATDHGGVAVTISSSNPAVALVAPNTATAGSASIEVFVPDGQQIASYVAQGVQSQASGVTFNASAPGFTPGSSTVNVVDPALQIVYLSSTTTANAADLPFRVGVGIPTANNTAISEYQPVRPGAGPLTATITSSAPSIGQLVTTGSSGASVTVEIAPSQSYSPSTVASGGVAFDPQASGTTSVNATIPNFTPTDAATVVVTVTP
ncbi:MAG: hypothetical protein AMJ53_06560, partial [Gammaproteobacteria bacterium SG8_11]